MDTATLASLRMAAGAALLHWIETTHGTHIGEHDHHCLAIHPTDPSICTCGWAEAERALSDLNEAEAEAERQRRAEIVRLGREKGTVSGG